MGDAGEGWSVRCLAVARRLQSPVDTSHGVVYSCRTCGALLAEADAVTHDEWHVGLGQGSTLLPKEGV